jgi:hypothetical protein
MSDRQLLREIAYRLIGLNRERMTSAEWKIYCLLNGACLVTIDENGEVVKWNDSDMAASLVYSGITK